MFWNNVVRKYFTLYIWVIFITRFILSFSGKYPGLDFFCSCDINLQLWLLIEVIILFNSIKIVLYYSRYHFKWLWWTCIQLNLEVLFACVLFQGIRVLHLPAWHLFLCNTPVFGTFLAYIMSFIMMHITVFEYSL